MDKIAGLKRIWLPVFFAVVCVVGSNVAEAGVPDCSGCTLPKVESLLPRCQYGDGYVTDFSKDYIMKGCYDFQGGGYRGPSGIGMPSGGYEIKTVPSLVAEEFERYHAVFANNGGILAEAASVHLFGNILPKVDLNADDGYMNAYDVVMSASNANALLDLLTNMRFTKSNTDLGGNSHNAALLSSVLAVLGSAKSDILSFDFDLTVRVIFHDGSSLEVVNTKSGGWNIVPGSERDAHGNPIPISAEDVGNGNAPGQRTANTYSFIGGNAYDETNFISLISLYGIGLAESGATGSTPPGIVCTNFNESDKPKIVCHYYK